MAANPKTYELAQADTQESSLYLLPPVDVVEDGSGITVYADLPGVSKDKLNVQVHGETLTIEAEMDLGSMANVEAVHAEVGASRYRRVFTLSKELDPQKLEAELKNGVLTLRIQKAEHAKPRRITIRAT